MRTPTDILARVLPVVREPSSRDEVGRDFVCVEILVRDVVVKTRSLQVLAFMPRLFHF